MNEQELIDRHIELDPDDLGPGEARLRESGVHVWAIIGDYLYVSNRDVAEVARGYELPVEDVQAAVAFYRRHKCEIDARLLENGTPV